MYQYARVKIVQQILRITYGVLFIIVGADKFFDYLVSWQQFIAVPLQSFLLVSPVLFIRFFGFVQILIGIFFFTRFFVYAAYTALILLLIIFINLLFTSTAMVVLTHDLMMIMMVIMLLILTHCLSRNEFL